MIPFFVKANTVNLVSDRYDNIYVYYYDAELGRTRFLEGSKYSFNGKVAYCLEIGKRISSMNYNIYDSFDNININNEDLNYIKLISYYGYNYPGHHTDKFYMATQELIWTRLIRTNVKWVNNMNPDSFVYIEREKEEIYDLYRKHYKKPSFDGKEIDLVLGDSNVINDENDTLYLYDVKTKGVSISGSNLIIDSDFDSGEIVLEKPKYISDNFLLYTSGSSQNMMTVGDINTPTSKVKVNLISGSVSINKLDNDTESDLPIGEASLKGSIYGLYNNDNVLVDKFIIGEKEKISHLPIGHYYVKEIKPGNGYLLDDNDYDVDITKDNLNISLTVYDEVIRRKVDLFKVYGTNETGIMTGEDGIKFIVYDKDNVLYDTIVTDSDGYASIILPYGTYTFHQDNSTPGYYKVDDFKVTIDTFDSRPIYKLLSDSEITSKIKIIKKDIDTLDNVVNSNIKFKIFDVQNDSYVSFKLTYPEVKVIDEFELNTDGIFVTPDTLPAGEYILSSQIFNPITILQFSQADISSAL